VPSSISTPFPPRVYRNNRLHPSVMEGQLLLRVVFGFVTHDKPSANFLFFKFHKVGGTTVTNTLRPVLMRRKHVLPSVHDTQEGRSVVAPGGTASASLCMDHASSLPMLSLFAKKSVLQAGRNTRVELMYQAAPKLLEQTCPLVRGLPLFTGVVLRDPVQRILSKYHFQRASWCARESSKFGLECAASALPLSVWLNVSTTAAVTTRDPTLLKQLALQNDSLLRVNQEVLLEKQCEPLARLGSATSCADPLALERAKTTLSAIDVVGISEQMAATLALLERRFALPYGVLANFTSYLVNCNRPNISLTEHKQINSHPAVRAERRLYKYALHRFALAVRHEGLTHLLVNHSEVDRKSALHSSHVRCVTHKPMI